MFIANYPFGS